jgi:hypothetical protein
MTKTNNKTVELKDKLEKFRTRELVVVRGCEILDLVSQMLSEREREVREYSVEIVEEYRWDLDILFSRGWDKTTIASRHNKDIDSIIQTLTP